MKQMKEGKSFLQIYSGPDVIITTLTAAERRAMVPSQSTPVGNITAADAAPSCTAQPMPPMALSTPLAAASSTTTERGGEKGCGRRRVVNPPQHPTHYHCR